MGQIDSGLPSVGLPDAPASDYLQLAGSAVGVALVGFAEGLGAAKTYAARQHYEIDRRGRRQPSPLIPSPISLAPITRHSTAMIAALWAPIHAFSSSRIRRARSPSVK